MSALLVVTWWLRGAIALLRAAIGLLRAALGRLRPAIARLRVASAWLRPVGAWLRVAVTWLRIAIRWLRVVAAWLRVARVLLLWAEPCGAAVSGCNLLSRVGRAARNPADSAATLATASHARKHVATFYRQLMPDFHADNNTQLGISRRDPSGFRRSAWTGGREVRRPLARRTAKASCPAWWRAGLTGYGGRRAA